ncbi:MAG TPA: exodeoxyribonuclease VII large subunit, partial [Kofleriaceae bacterium]|nr:exodeoxyribonuclease VII large subunit [Kofleriaceae bacterium]
MATSRPPSSRERPLGVAEIVRLAGRALDELGLVWLEGEVTQVTQPGSGHLYFALQDRGCVLPAVMWSRDLARMRFKVQPGQRLRVRGRLGVYDRDGKMQLYADFAEPAGAGAEAVALEQLKAKLAAEGLFAAAKKRKLPRFPRRIGVVTSAHGAAVHDIIRTVQRRLPTPILIADAAVQGPNAPHQLVQGMAMVVRAGVDVVIVGRGGGAATDLTAFNHERVVRTIARCPVPVISAVGHETDLSLADLAADARASTPTAAAELAVPDGFAIGETIAKE